jgi:hypothetical protein
LPEIVQEIGAYAGLASVVGLAVLSALYFSQARDVKRLREWAGRAPERAGGQAPVVPGRVGAQPARAPGQPAVPGTPAAAARPAAAPAAAAGARPATAAAPATGAAAATPAATPAPRPAQPVPAPSGGSPGAGTAAPAPAAASAGTAAPAKPAEAGQNAASQKAAPDAPVPGSPTPKSPPGNAGAPKDAAPGAGAPAARPAARPGSSPPVPPPNRASPTVAERPGGPTRPTAQPTTVIPPAGKPPWYRSVLSNPLYAVLAVAGVLIVGGAAAFGITQLASDGGGDSSQSQSAGTGNDNETQGNENAGGADPGKDKSGRGGSVRPSSVTVAVLNGTTVPGLAATLADQVTSAGFKAGTVANFTNNQQLAESVVQYASGHEREAAAVSRRLGIDQREAATANSRELAGDATVIVIAGGDKAP